MEKLRAEAKGLREEMEKLKAEKMDIDAHGDVDEDVMEKPFDAFAAGLGESPLVFSESE